MKLIRNTLFILALASFFSSNAFGGEESYTFKAAPEFTLRSTKGKKVSLSDYKGSVVLINFWATWCAPCIQELPSLQRIHDDLNKEGFTDKSNVTPTRIEDLVTSNLANLVLRFLPQSFAQTDAGGMHDYQNPRNLKYEGRYNLLY